MRRAPPDHIIKSPCSSCDGRRFTEQVLSYRRRGKSIHDVLVMGVAAALEFFDGSIAEKLRPLQQVGLSDDCETNDARDPLRRRLRASFF